MLNGILATFAGMAVFDPLACARPENPLECDGIELADEPLWTFAFVLHIWAASLSVVLVIFFQMIGAKVSLEEWLTSNTGFRLYMIPSVPLPP